MNVLLDAAGHRVRAELKVEVYCTQIIYTVFSQSLCVTLIHMQSAGTRNWIEPLEIFISREFKKAESSAMRVKASQAHVNEINLKAHSRKSITRPELICFGALFLHSSTIRRSSPSLEYDIEGSKGRAKTSLIKARKGWMWCDDRGCMLPALRLPAHTHGWSGGAFKKRRPRVFRSTHTHRRWPFKKPRVSPRFSIW